LGIWGVGVGEKIFERESGSGQKKDYTKEIEHKEGRIF
jgi:hypothetical protein